MIENKKVGRKTIINAQLIEEVKELKDKNLPIRIIANQTGVSKSTIYNILRNHLNYKSNFKLKNDQASENN